MLIYIFKLTILIILSSYTINSFIFSNLLNLKEVFKLQVKKFSSYNIFLYIFKLYNF